MLELVTGNVLDAKADALLLTIDGAKRGMEGNIARQFARRWPDDWEDIRRAVRYPVPIGRTVAVSWNGDFPWRLILFASTLHHLDVLDDRQKRSVIRTSLTEALHLCVWHRTTILATALLQGGWRLGAEDALQEMRLTYLSSGCLQVRLVVCKLANDLLSA